jgi:pantothenate kinase type III
MTSKAPVEADTDEASDPVHIAAELQKSSWPESCLLDNEKQFVSVCIGNTSLHWATHGFAKPSSPSPTDSNPSFFWRTPHLVPEEIDADLECEDTTDNGKTNGNATDHDDANANNAELINTLCRHIPQTLSDFFFGFSSTPNGNGESEPKRRSQTLRSAHEQNKIRGHIPTFYLVSTNSQQSLFLSKVLGSIPCRIYLLQSHDFYTAGQGAYIGMGVDRLANLRGAVGIKGLPALVIDGGSALTYTAVGCNGNIMGGGISPGFEMRMRAMNEFTCALPNVDVVKYLQEVGKMEVPPGIFAGDTERGMVVSLLNEVGCGLRGVVSAWKDDARVKDARKSPSAAGKKRKTASAGAGAAVAGKDVKELDNKDLLVTVTGGSGPTIVKLLKKDNGDILDFGAVPNPDISMQHILGLQHFGIAAVLCEKSKRDYTAPYVAEGNKEKQNEGSAAKKAKDAVKYDVYVVKRVAKEFEVPDEDGDHIYRGQVLSYSVYDGDKGIEPYFRVVYTDGDEEDVDFQDLKCTFVLVSFH